MSLSLNELTEGEIRIFRGLLGWVLPTAYSCPRLFICRAGCKPLPHPKTTTRFNIGYIFDT